MITLSSKSNLLDGMPIEMYGLSTDEKPTDISALNKTMSGAMPNGSTFVEMDTSAVYFYDGENKTYRKF